MSFTQCKNEEEVESFLEKVKVGFVTEDHRVYSEIELGDNAVYYKLNAETVNALYQLQSNIEMLSDGRCENSFTSIVGSAIDLANEFKKVQKLIKENPIQKVTK